MLKQNILLTLLIILNGLYQTHSAQNIPIGTWQDHLPYRDAISVTEGKDIIYCATNSALFTYNLSDHSIEKLTQINGLSDIGISKVKFNSYNNRLIIAYKNGNIDIIDENQTIINLSFIKSSNVVGSKQINHIFLNNNLAYLSTDFGIVVINTDKLEVKDTYLIGNLGSYVKVNAITIDTLNIYAATDEGVYIADKSNPNLVNYNNWSKVLNLKDSAYSNIITHQNKLIIIQDRGIKPDSIFYGDAGVWKPFNMPEGYTNNLCILNENDMAIVWEWGVSFFDNNQSKYAEIYNYSPQEVFRAKDFSYWLADDTKGLVHFKNPWDSNVEIFTPNSPYNINAFDINFVNNNLWYVTGGYNPNSLNPSFFSKHIVNYKKNNTWYSLGKIIPNINGGTTFDPVCVAINPSNNEQVFIGTWNDGLYEVNNGSVTNIYTAQNSNLDSTFFGTTKIGDIVFDDDNNLWVSSSSNGLQIDVKTPDNTWYNYQLTNIQSVGAITNLIIDRNNYKWMSTQNAKEIIVFDDNNTLENTGDDRVTLLNNFNGIGIFSITSDQDGEIWIGTDEGIAVFYNPSQAFDENIEAQQIYIQQDGQTQILLETETVTAIAVDGANRKWIGTQNS